MRTNVGMRIDARIVNESKLKRYNYFRLELLYNIVISDFGISLLSRRDEKISLSLSLSTGWPIQSRDIQQLTRVCYGWKMFARWKLGQFCAFLDQYAQLFLHKRFLLRNTFESIKFKALSKLDGAPCVRVYF